MKYVPFTSKNAGFTLVEVLVAITILLLVITGPMRTISRANTTTAFSSEQVTAFFLAQEGLELIQKGRDDVVLEQFREDFGGAVYNEDPWDDFKSDFSSCESATGCSVSWAVTGTDDTVTISSCATPSNCLLHVRPGAARDVYTHVSTGNSPTIFTRTIRMDFIGGGPGGRDVGAIATSTVTWRTGSLIAGQKVELVTYITNVYDQQ